jgi:hypothetical protein
VSTCRSCNAPIIWARNNQTGASMILDADPVSNGNIVVYFNAPKPLATVLGRLDAQMHEGPLYVSHFSTCPDGKTWRRR